MNDPVLPTVPTAPTAQVAPGVQGVPGAAAPGIAPAGTNPGIPDYLNDTYWWAYVRPWAVQIFERQWLVNLILWGNFNRLREAALDLLGASLPGRTLQIACVYGDLTPHLLRRLEPADQLDVVDILPVQLHNLARKLGPQPRVSMHLGDSSHLPFADASYDRALLFFLLHEQPAAVRSATLAEALRVLKPGGELVIVDYHRPRATHPLRLPMACILRTLEPYAMDLWRHEIEAWLPRDFVPAAFERSTLFGGLYQLIRIRV